MSLLAFFVIIGFILCPRLTIAGVLLTIGQYTLAALLCLYIIYKIALYTEAYFN